MHRDQSSQCVHPVQKAKSRNSYWRHDTPESVEPVVGFIVDGVRAREMVVERKSCSDLRELAGNGSESLFDRYTGVLRSLSASLQDDDACQCRLKIVCSIHIRDAEIVAFVPFIVQLPAGCVMA